MMQPYDQNQARLIYEVNKNLHMLSQMLISYRGVSLQVPPSLQSAYERFVKLSRRNQKGDFRWSVEEMQAMREIAQWSIDIHCELRGQPRRILDWSTGQLHTLQDDVI